MQRPSTSTTVRGDTSVLPQKHGWNVLLDDRHLVHGLLQDRLVLHLVVVFEMLNVLHIVSDHT